MDDILTLKDPGWNTYEYYYFFNQITLKIAFENDSTLKKIYSVST